MAGRLMRSTVCSFEVLSMNYVILVFAVIMLITGAIILVNPMTVFGLMSTHSKSLKLHVFAVVVRLFVGAVLITSAQNSKFPLTFEVLGGLFILAGIILSVIGRNKFKKLVEWAMNLVPLYGRASGAFAILFGGFLGYAVL